MLSLNECPFCSDTKFKNNDLFSLPIKDIILFENENLWVKVDIGPLCVGHILIITQNHYLNFGELSNEIKKDVRKLKEKIKRVYSQVYGTDVLFFEHGSTLDVSAGASINHAHLHCIPYNFDVSGCLNELLGEPFSGDWSSFNNNKFSYLYLESEQIGKLIYKVDALTSQFLRELVAQKMGMDKYSWQDLQQRENNKKI